MVDDSRQQQRQNVIDALNKARSMELKAINQYMNHHYFLEAADFGDMAAKEKLIAIDEMRHAEMFAERIEELGGTPTTEPDSKIELLQDPGRIFAADQQLEDGAIQDYNVFLNTCRENGDSSSSKLFETVIDEEQLHFNYFQVVSEHIEKLGQSYLANVAGTPSATGITYQGFAQRQSQADQPGGGGATGA